MKTYKCKIVSNVLKALLNYLDGLDHVFKMLSYTAPILVGRMLWKEIVVLWLYLTHSVRSEDLIRLKQSKLYELYLIINHIHYLPKCWPALCKFTFSVLYLTFTVTTPCTPQCHSCT